jgi:hypothetical protein
VEIHHVKPVESQQVAGPSTSTGANLNAHSIGMDKRRKEFVSYEPQPVQPLRVPQ